MLSNPIALSAEFITPVPSSKVSQAYVLKRKFIHMGAIKSTKSTAFFLKVSPDSMSAMGYPAKRQITVAIRESFKLLAKTFIRSGLINSLKFSTENFRISFSCVVNA